MKLFSKFKKSTEEKPDNKSESRIDLEKERKEILAKARKYIYPLHITRRQIFIRTALLGVVALVGTIGALNAILYHYQLENNFTYQITRLVPYPVASVDGYYARYEAYLFELRYNRHFLETHEAVNFSSKNSQERLNELRAAALEKAKEYRLIEAIANEEGIRVLDEEVDQRIQLLRTQATELNINALENPNEDVVIDEESNDDRFEDVLREFYDWDEQDLRRVIRLQLLKNKLAPVLDQEAEVKVEKAQQRLINGASFSELAKELSDDRETAPDGGRIGTVRDDLAEFPPNFIQTASELEQGKISDIVQTDFGYHLIKKSKAKKGKKPIISHIVVAYENPDVSLKQRLKNAEQHNYIDIPNNK